jgi:hypothetical protein
MIFHFVGQAILPAAAFQAALGCGCAALWGSFASCCADFIGALELLWRSMECPILGMGLFRNEVTNERKLVLIVITQ